MDYINAIKVLAPAATTFAIGIALTPFLTGYLYRNKMWKKRAGKKALDGKDTPLFNELHKEKEVGTPKMGGLIIWGSVLVSTAVFSALALALPTGIASKLDFLSRDQTWLPIFALLAGGLVGLIDDYLETQGGGDHIAGGLSLKKRLLVVGIIGLVAALWFYFKLDVSEIGLPFSASIDLGIFFIPFFLLVVWGIYSSGVIDGIDGLAGGIFATIFASYSLVAFFQNQINLAAFSAVVTGAILAFLWFNIPPARFYMSETGSMGLTLALAFVAFLTDSLADGHGVLALPIIAMPLVATTLSNVIQVASKKIRGKKVFLIAPLHHHFEAIGWPFYKVTMRYWIFGTVMAGVGVIFALIG